MLRVDFPFPCLKPEESIPTSSRQRARSRINVLLCHCEGAIRAIRLSVSARRNLAPVLLTEEGRGGAQDPERSGFCLDLDERCPEVNVQVIPSTSLVTSSRTCTENREQGREAPASCSDHISPDSDTWQKPSQGGRTRLAPNQADSDSPEASSVVLQVHHSGKRREGEFQECGQRRASLPDPRVQMSSAAPRLIPPSTRQPVTTDVASTRHVRSTEKTGGGIPGATKVFGCYRTCEASQRHRRGSRRRCRRLLRGSVASRSLMLKLTPPGFSVASISSFIQPPAPESTGSVKSELRVRPEQNAAACGRHTGHGAPSLHTNARERKRKKRERRVCDISPEARRKPPEEKTLHPFIPIPPSLINPQKWLQ
ncbi:hypothetical protein D4764_04G0011480 [Takifugu flavidus]|uniref:Uncharacterized protein n=1 Tax=Takifugu flavidus TaxID=433684 RepID=A0A5C6N886_9TELE|nr:hypothetical protein D4764_04G0011480 [Takifugu flavidus]